MSVSVHHGTGIVTKAYDDVTVRVGAILQYADGFCVYVGESDPVDELIGIEATEAAAVALLEGELESREQGR